MSENNKAANTTTNQNEFEINTPHKENEDITTTQPSTEQNKTGKQTGFESGEKNQENKQTQNSKLTENDQQKRNDDDKEREERKNPNDAKYQDAGWQQDKMNEASNEDGNPVDGKGNANGKAGNGVSKEAEVSDEEKKKGVFGDTRKDSIIDRPKTETYEKDSEQDTSKAIKEANYQHAREEEKRKKENTTL